MHGGVVCACVNATVPAYDRRCSHRAGRRATLRAAHAALEASVCARAGGRCAVDSRERRGARGAADRHRRWQVSAYRYCGTEMKRPHAFHRRALLRVRRLVATAAPPPARIAPCRACRTSLAISPPVESRDRFINWILIPHRLYSIHEHVTGGHTVSSSLVEPDRLRRLFLCNHCSLLYRYHYQLHHQHDMRLKVLFASACAALLCLSFVVHFSLPDHQQPTLSLAWGSNMEQQQQQQQQEQDPPRHVVIIGSGLAGLVAAIEAARTAPSVEVCDCAFAALSLFACCACCQGVARDVAMCMYGDAHIP